VIFISHARLPFWLPRKNSCPTTKHIAPCCLTKFGNFVTIHNHKHITTYCIVEIIFFSMAQQPPVVQGLFIIEVAQLHSDTAHSVGLLLDKWSVRRRDLYLTTHITHKRHSCPRRNSNPQSQQASDRKPMPLTALSLGPAWNCNTERSSGITHDRLRVHENPQHIYIIIISHAMFSSNTTLIRVPMHEIKPFWYHKCIHMIYR